MMYDPLEAGKTIITNKGKKIVVRKYHSTAKEIKIHRDRWLKDIEDVDSSIVEKAGKEFFNPYRKGIYYYQIQTLFLLGANEWHSFKDILQKLEEHMKGIFLETRGVDAWEDFRYKGRRDSSTRCKDYIGRIQENMIFFQRLSKYHPYGYRLRQANAALDMKRVSKDGIPNGLFFYRLSTFDTKKKALPIRDYSRFNFPKSEGNYVSYKFIGTIITKTGEKKLIGRVKK